MRKMLLLLLLSLFTLSGAAAQEVGVWDPCPPWAPRVQPNGTHWIVTVWSRVLAARSWPVRMCGHLVPRPINVSVSGCADEEHCIGTGDTTVIYVRNNVVHVHDGPEFYTNYEASTAIEPGPPVGSSCEADLSIKANTSTCWFAWDNDAIGKRNAYATTFVDSDIVSHGWCDYPACTHGEPLPDPDLDAESKAAFEKLVGAPYVPLP